MASFLDKHNAYMAALRLLRAYDGPEPVEHVKAYYLLRYGNVYRA